MKVYIVTADYYEDIVICGVALDKETAEKIAACEEANDSIKPMIVSIEEYDTDDYMPLNNGLYPFEVRNYDNGRVIAARTSLNEFKHGFIEESIHCLTCQVYATDEVHALEQSSKLLKEQLN